MFRLLIGMLIGAAIVYLVDSQYLDGRRRMLKDRFGRGHVADFTERADEAIQASHVTRATIDDAKARAQEWSEATRERADSVTDSAPNR